MSIFKGPPFPVGQVSIVLDGPAGRTLQVHETLGVVDLDRVLAKERTELQKNVFAHAGFVACRQKEWIVNRRERLQRRIKLGQQGLRHHGKFVRMGQAPNGDAVARGFGRHGVGRVGGRQRSASSAPSSSYRLVYDRCIMKPTSDDTLLRLLGHYRRVGGRAARRHGGPRRYLRKASSDRQPPLAPSHNGGTCKHLVEGCLDTICQSVKSLAKEDRMYGKVLLPLSISIVLLPRARCVVVFLLAVSVSR